MPLQRCTSEDNPGWKWGDSGHCYPYESGNAGSERTAKEKALTQGRAIEISKHKR